MPHLHHLNNFNYARFKRVSVTEKLKHRILHRIQMNFNMLHNCTKFVINKITISKKAFYRRMYVHFCGKRVLNFGVDRSRVS